MQVIQAALLLLATFEPLVTATPTPAEQFDKKSFTHHVKRNINKRGLHAGHEAMTKAFNKWNFGTVTRRSFNIDDESDLVARGEQGQVSAVPEPNESEYLSPVEIGGQLLHLDFDTGSSDLWVFSSALSAKTVGAHNVYDPTKSSSFQSVPGHSWSISYGDGSGAAGTVGKDTVNIGGATATGQAVEMATAVSASFVKDANNDGLVGLAFSSLNTVKPNKQSTFFETIMPQLSQPIFSVDLKNDSSGTYLFGAVDQSRFVGTLTTIPITPNTGFWQVNSPTFQIGKTKVANQGGSPAIADTGTSLMLVDPQVAKAYYAQVPGAVNNVNLGGYTYPCSAAVPDFGVSLGPGYMAMIPSHEVTFAQIDSKTCFGGIQSNGGSNLQIYGDVFFKAQYVVFDGANKQLHVAPKAGLF